MSRRLHRLRWIPPFLVGATAAAAAEVAVGLLLYSGPGLVRSLTTVLGVEAAAFGVGLWTAPGPRPDLLDSLRRRWLLCLVAFLVATLFTAFWSVEVVGGSAVGQGLGLALMGGLPLYACGGVLGTMASVNAADGSSGGISTGASAFLGAALGFGATGVSLPEVLTPASLLLICLVLLSAGGLVYGSVLDSHVRVAVRGQRPAAVGDVRVEDRHLLSGDDAGRFLLEGAHVRRWMPLGGDDLVPWDLAAFRSLFTEDGGPYRVLLLGGGASPVPRAAAQEHPFVLIDVAERVPAVVDLAREHMDTDVTGDGAERIRFHLGNMSDLLEGLTGPYHLIVLDTSACAPVGGFAGMSRRFRGMLWSRLDSSGAVVVGPLAPDEGTFAAPAQWTSARYRRPVGSRVDALRMCVPGEEVVLIARPAAAGPLPSGMDGFVRQHPDPAVAQGTGGSEDAK